MRLRTSLYLVAATTAAPLLFFAVATATYVFNQEQSSLLSAVQGRNRATLAAVDGALQETVGVLRALSGDESLQRDDLAAMHFEAKAMLATQLPWRNVYLERPDGSQVANALRPPSMPLRLHPLETKSLEAAIATLKPTFSDFTLAPSTDAESGIRVRLPIVRNGVVAFILTAVVDVQRFQQILEDQHLPPGWVSGLTGQDGRLIARVPSVEPGSLASIDFRRQLQANKEGWYRGKTIEGADTFTAFSTSELTGWTIGYAMPAAVIVGSAKHVAMLMAAGIALSIACGMVIAYFFSNRISRPMSKLANAAQLLGTGQELPRVASSVDEVTRLSEALAGAGHAIRERDREIEKSHEELRQQASTLMLADTNKSKFLAVLSHELRNPLAALSAGLALLSKTHSLERIASTRDMMRRQIDHMTHLIADLMDTGRIDRGQLEMRLKRICIDDVVKVAVETSEHGIEAKQQQLLIALPQHRVFVDGDALRLAQVFSNVLNNASKYTPVAGRIEVTVRETEREVEIAVSDTGSGFESIQANSIFDMFVRLDGTREHHADGLGVGLTIARTVVERHGGTIVAASEGPGRGATFTVTLPRANPPFDGFDSASEHQIRLDRTRRILVADDNRDAADALAEVLRIEGFSVKVCYDGQQALDEILSFEPAVAFLDLDMPQMSGLEVARRLRAQPTGSSILLVAVTGLGQKADRDTAREAGFDRHLTKPPKPMEVVQLAGGAMTHSIADG